MRFETKVTWEKLLLEIRDLGSDDHSSLIPLLVGTNAILWPKEKVEELFREVRFLEFELSQECEGLSKAESLNRLRAFFFETKRFQPLTTRWSQMEDEDLLMKSIFESRIGHPLPLTLLFLHLGLSLKLPLTLVQTYPCFLLKWSAPGEAFYLKMIDGACKLSDCEAVQLLQKNAPLSAAFDARNVYRAYLDELMQFYEKTGQSQSLHTIYNLCLQVDDGNLPILARRALLRQRLGFAKEALTDLKRYFSFVERGHAPIELQKALSDLESMDIGRDSSSGMLH